MSETNISTRLACIHGTVVAVRVSPATALVDVGDPTDAEIEALHKQHPQEFRKVSEYLKKHNSSKDEAYKHIRCGFGTEE